MLNLHCSAAKQRIEYLMKSSKQQKKKIFKKTLFFLTEFRKKKKKLIDCNFKLEIADVAGIQQTHINEDAASLANIPEALH